VLKTQICVTRPAQL